MLVSVKNVIRAILTFSLLLPFVVVQAQYEEEENECVRILQKAQKAYEGGLIEKVDQMIRPCLEGNQLSKEDKMEGWKLIAMSHTYDGKDDLAEDAMLHFLKLDPEYQIQPGVDPKEFTDLYSNFHTDPLYTVGIYGGPNWANAFSYKEFGGYNTATDKKSYTSKSGFQIGVRGTRYLYKGLNVHLDLTFMQSSFVYGQDILESYTNVDPNGDPVEAPTKGVSIGSTESQQVLSIPISFSYTFMPQKMLRPYVLAGFETRYLLSASNEIQKSPLDPNIASVEIPDIENFQETRSNLTFSALFAVGGKYKITRGDLFAEVRYHVGISDQLADYDAPVNEDERLWNFYQQDNEFTINTFMINFGYNLYLYKPRKIKAGEEVPEQPKQKKEKKPKKEKESKKRQVIE